MSYNHKFEGEELPADEIRVTVKITKVLVGTEIEIVQEGIPAVIPISGCYLGWQESRRHLAKLVEPEIPQ